MECNNRAHVKQDVAIDIPGGKRSLVSYNKMAAVS